jgi:hypothetical protein
MRPAKKLDVWSLEVEQETTIHSLRVYCSCPFDPASIKAVQKKKRKRKSTALLTSHNSA